MTCIWNFAFNTRDSNIEVQSLELGAFDFWDREGLLDEAELVV